MIISIYALKRIYSTYPKKETIFQPSQNMEMNFSTYAKKVIFQPTFKKTKMIRPTLKQEKIFQAKLKKNFFSLNLQKNYYF